MDSKSTAQFVSRLKERLTSAQKYEEFERHFSSLTTDLDRIAYIDTLTEFQDLIEVKESFKPKNERAAEMLRADGNKLFKEGNYQAAADKYTQSILIAPTESSNLALAYGNRSTACFYLKQYRLCLKDIEMAFLHKYPKSTCYKLYQRLGRCLYYLRCKNEAIKAFQQTIAVLMQTSEIDEKNRTEMIDDMTKAIEKCEGIKQPVNTADIEDIYVFHQKVPELSAEPNEEVPCLSDAVEIQMDRYGGRGLFAKQNIEIGEVLIVETPYSSVLLKEYNLSHCHLCCNRVILPLPCTQCSGVVFCSLACRNEAWRKFHWAECRILESIQDSKGDLGLLATRMIITTGWQELVKISEEGVNKEMSRKAGFNEEDKYRSDVYRSSYSLVNHSEDRSFNDLLNRTISALFFLKHLELVGFFSNSVQSPDEAPDLDPDLEKRKHFVGAHILRNIMMLPCNAHEVSEFSLNIASPAMSCVTELAAAIYPVLSLINHSCDPSVVRHSFGNVCVARAIRSIPAGEELKDNYGALYPTMEKSQRQSDLRSQYFFDCSCEACQEDWPLYFDIPCERPVFRCKSCGGRVPIPENNLTEFAKCLSCSKTQDITQILLNMGKMESSYKDALTAVIDGNNSAEDINTLLTYLRYVERNVRRPWRDVNDSQEAIKQCLNMQANSYPAEI